jgi:hypothetical protein
VVTRAFAVVVDFRRWMEGQSRGQAACLYLAWAIAAVLAVSILSSD